MSLDYEYGLFGHPWKQSIYEVGEKIIELFERKRKILGIREEKNEI